MRRGIRLAYSHVWNQQGCLQSSASGQTVYTALTCQQRRQLQKQANQVRPSNLWVDLGAQKK